MNRPQSDRDRDRDRERTRGRPDAVGDRRTNTAAFGAVAGAVGGLLGTVTMTAFRIPISRSLPPTAAFWARFVAGGNLDDHALPAVVLHLLYGTVAGSALGASVVPRLGGSETEVERVRGGTFWGLAYGLGLSQFGLSILLERLLGMELDADERFVFHVGHAIYGLTLGAWLGSNAADGA